MPTENQDKVINLVAETIESASGRAMEVTLETELIASGYLDSLALLQLFSQLQEEFNVELSADDITEESFSSPKTIAELIEDRL